MHGWIRHSRFPPCTTRISGWKHSCIMHIRDPQLHDPWMAVLTPTTSLGLGITNTVRRVYEGTGGTVKTVSGILALSQLSMTSVLLIVHCEPTKSVSRVGKQALGHCLSADVLLPSANKLSINV